MEEKAIPKWIDVLSDGNQAAQQLRRAINGDATPAANQNRGFQSANSLVNWNRRNKKAVAIADPGEKQAFPAYHAYPTENASFAKRKATTINSRPEGETTVITLLRAFPSDSNYANMDLT